MVVRADQRGGGWLTTICLLVSLNACRAPAAVSATPLLATSRSFGDTVAVKVQLLSLDPVDEVARVSLGASAYLVVLGVRPGREIELIAPEERAPTRSTGAGAATLSLRRYEEPSPDANLRAEVEYERCVAVAEEAARRREQARTAKRDSAGRVIPGSGRSSVQAPVVSHNCRRPTTPAKRVRMAPRAAADRYLVVLASSQPIPYAQLSARLETLTAVAPDVATTIEAIAAGIYAGHPGAFSGTFVSW
jgi:hypothetical protein